MPSCVKFPCLDPSGSCTTVLMGVGGGGGCALRTFSGCSMSMFVSDVCEAARGLMTVRAVCSSGWLE